MGTDGRTVIMVGLSLLGPLLLLLPFPRSAATVGSLSDVLCAPNFAVDIWTSEAGRNLLERQADTTASAPSSAVLSRARVMWYSKVGDSPDLWRCLVPIAFGGHAIMIEGFAQNEECRGVVLSG